MQNLEGKTALVTGASKGIGRGIALKLASLGADVIINYNGSADSANEVLDSIKAINKKTKSSIYKCNVSSYQDTKLMIDDILDKYGKIDVLVNNAGITRDNLLMRMKEEEFDAVINTNLKGCFNCMQLVSRDMIKKRYGKIINISSVSGVMGNVGQVNYAASKAGVIGMTKSAAREMAARGITVNAIAPGFIKTDMTDVLGDKIKDEIKANIPMKRFGEVEDIANIVAFLADDAAAYITGQTISVDGGMHM